MDSEFQEESMLVSVRGVDDAGHEAAQDMEEVHHAEGHGPAKGSNGRGGWASWAWHKLLASFEDAFWKAVILLIALGLLAMARAFLDWTVAFAQ